MYYNKGCRQYLLFLRIILTLVCLFFAELSPEESEDVLFKEVLNNKPFLAFSHGFFLVLLPAISSL